MLIARIPFNCFLRYYSSSKEEFRQAAWHFKDQADLIMQDSMGYTDVHRELAARYAGVPVVLSNALIGKNGIGNGVSI